MLKFNKKSKGFTLLEVIVAIGIITVGVVGILSLLAQSAKDIRGADHSLIAAQLAQEAIEVVVNIRHTNWIQQRDWRTGLDQGGPVITNYDNTALVPNPPEDLLCLAWTGGHYIHDTEGQCLFRRYIEIINQGTYLEVRATVEWTEGDNTQHVILVDHLYDWR